MAENDILPGLTFGTVVSTEQALALVKNQAA